MTIVLKEIHAVSQTLDQGVPNFKGRALLAYGHDRSDHGVVSTRSGPVSWGFQTETDQMQAAAGFSITSPGSLETGGSRISDGPAFYSTILGGASTPAENLGLDFFGCGEVALNVVDPRPAYLGLFVMGGKTLQTAVGYGSFSGTGPLAITGLGFQPDLILMGGAGRTTLGGPDAFNAGLGFTYGAADGSGNQFACAVGSQYISSTSGRTSRTVNDACFLQVKPSIFKASLTSMDVDGFTLDASGTVGAQLFWWVAIHDPDGQFAVGTATEGDGSFSPGFTPEAAMFASTGNTVFGTSQGGCGFCLGGADSSGSAAAGFEAAAAGNFYSKNYWSTNAISLIRHPTGSVSAPLAEATVSSWGSTCNLNWSSSTATGVKFGWVAMKTSVGPGFAGCGGFVPQIYRVLKH